MQFKNSLLRYGWVAILLHWGMALAIIGMFGLGLYMRSLGYYDPLYHELPHYHKSIGLILLLCWVIRLLWKWYNVGPVMDGRPWEKVIARIVHGLLYGLLLAIFVSGYLISTADGRAIQVFNWFEVPALWSGWANLEDIAGWWHYWLAVSLMVLVGLHVLAALKHHFINRDATLRRMSGLS